MGYINKILTFVSGKIFYPDVKSRTGERAVMMDWEDPIMAAHAQYVAENGGNVLEIGFGLGISANYIQSYRPKSHTIIEIHPEIRKLLENGNWQKAKETAQRLGKSLVSEGYQPDGLKVTAGESWARRFEPRERR